MGKRIMEAVVNDTEFGDYRGMLATRDAHGLYEKFGYVADGNRFMSKDPLY